MQPDSAHLYKEDPPADFPEQGQTPGIRPAEPTRCSSQESAADTARS